MLILVSYRAISRLLEASEWPATAIKPICRTVQLVCDPRVRQQALQFFYERIRLAACARATRRNSPTIQHSATGASDDDGFFDGSIEFLTIGITDLWSAVRKEFAVAAAEMAALFPPPSSLDALIVRLLQIAGGILSVNPEVDHTTQWIEKEGALLAVSRLLQSIRRESVTSVDSSRARNETRVVDDIRGMLRPLESTVVVYHVGTNTSLKLDRLPREVTLKLKPLLYRTLTHDQLTVRQVASNCLMRYVLLCDESTRLLVFQEIISKLNQLPNDQLDALSQEHADISLLGAFEAEGLLDVLAKLVPALPTTFLIKHWRYVFPTLERYVMHIASSVRQQSSMVVSSMAELASRRRLASTTDGGTSTRNPVDSETELLVHILLSFSTDLAEGSNCCWQKCEGRLLSIDVLVNFLGGCILQCEVDAHSGDFLDKESVDRHISGKDNLLAYEQQPIAAWLADSPGDKQKAGNLKIKPAVSILELIDTWLTNNSGKGGIPSCAPLFWEGVIRGWTAEAYKGFLSTQFELQRISKQVTPGLMCLSVWLRQLEHVQTIVLNNPSVDRSWRWLCVKYLLYQLRFLQERASVIGPLPELPAISSCEDIVWNCILELLHHSDTTGEDVEGVVAKVEVLAMTFLHFQPPQRAPHTLLTALDQLLCETLDTLPQNFQVSFVPYKPRDTRRESTSLDRQLCISLVRMLPAIVDKLFHLYSLADIDTTSRGVDALFSQKHRWLALVRVALSWLTSSDMMRWIVIPKANAHAQISSLLLMLSQHSPVDLTKTEIESEFAFIVHHLHAIIEREKQGSVVSTTVLDILLTLWSRWNQNAQLPMNPFVLCLAVTFDDSESGVHTTDTVEAGKLTETSAWDDWDEDGDDETRDAVHVDPPTGIASQRRDNAVVSRFRQLSTDSVGLLLNAMKTAAHDPYNPQHQRLRLAEEQIRLELRE